MSFNTKYYKGPNSCDRLLAIIRRAKERNLFDEILDPVRAVGVTILTVPPWHTADQIAQNWPLLCVGFLGHARGTKITPARFAKLASQNGWPIVKSLDGNHCFTHRGKVDRYYHTVNLKQWSTKRWTQEQFDQMMEH